MNHAVDLVALGGSLLERSTSLMALEAAATGARERGARVQVFSVRSLELPLYSPDADPPPAATRLADAVRECHGMIWSSPLYHGAVSGSFKNAVDWLEVLATGSPPYLARKVVGLIGVAGGNHALQAINTMELIVRSLRGWTLPRVVPVAYAERTFDSSGIRDVNVLRRLRQLGAEVVEAAKLLSGGAVDAPVDRDVG